MSDFPSGIFSLNSLFGTLIRIVCIAWEYFSFVCGRTKVSQRQQSFGGRVGDQTEKRRVSHFFKLRFFERIKKLFQTIYKKGTNFETTRKIYKRDIINKNSKMDDLKMELFEEVKFNIFKLTWRTFFQNVRVRTFFSLHNFSRTLIFSIFRAHFFDANFRRWNTSNPTSI